MKVTVNGKPVYVTDCRVSQERSYTYGFQPGTLSLRVVATCKDAKSAMAIVGSIDRIVIRVGDFVWVGEHQQSSEFGASATDNLIEVDCVWFDSQSVALEGET